MSLKSQRRYRGAHYNSTIKELIATIRDMRAGHAGRRYRFGGGYYTEAPDTYWNSLQHQLEAELTRGHSPYN